MFASKTCIYVPLLLFYISLKECSFIIYSTFLGRRRIGSLRFQLSDGLNKAEKGKTYTFNVRVKDLSIHLERHERYSFTLAKVDMAKKIIIFAVKKLIGIGYGKILASWISTK